MKIPVKVLQSSKHKSFPFPIGEAIMWQELRNTFDGIHKHNLTALDVLRSQCLCGKYFESNPYTGQRREITKTHADFCTNLTQDRHNRDESY